MAFTVSTSLSYQSYVNVNFPYIEVPAGTTGPVTVTLQSSVTPFTQTMLTTARSGSAISFWDETGLWTAKGPVADVNVLMAGLMWFPGSMSSSFAFTYKCVDGAGTVQGTGSVVVTGTASRPTPTISQPANLVTLVANVTDMVDFATVNDPVNGFLTASIQFNRVPGDSQYSTAPIVKFGYEATGYAQILSGYYGFSKSTWNSGTIAADPNDASWFPVWSMCGPAEDVRTALRNLRIKTPSTLKPFQMALKVSNGAGSSPRVTVPADQPNSAYNMTASLTNPAAVNEDTTVNVTGTLSGNASSRLHTIVFSLGDNLTSANLNTFNSKITVSNDPVAKTTTISGYLSDMTAAFTNGFRFTPVTDYNGAVSVPWTLNMEGNPSANIAGNISLSFTAVNDNPKFSSIIDPVMLVEAGTGASRTAVAYDPDAGQTITGYALSGAASTVGATIVSSTGVITIPSAILFTADLTNSVNTVTVTATSSDGTTVSQNFNVTYQHRVTLEQAFTV